MVVGMNPVSSDNFAPVGLLTKDQSKTECIFSRVVDRRPLAREIVIALVNILRSLLRHEKEPQLRKTTHLHREKHPIPLLTESLATNADMVNKDAINHSVQMGNMKRTAEDVHAILKSYYKVACKRFDDVVCMQAADYFLVTGSESPLRLFTPPSVRRLSSDSLNSIAGKDIDSKRTGFSLSFAA